VFNAKSYSVEGVETTPIKEQRDSSNHNYVAEYIGPSTAPEITEIGVIFYHIDEFNGLCKQERIVSGEYKDAIHADKISPLPSFVQYFILSELHELCHWAIPEDEQPDKDDEHSPVWNALLMDIIEDVPSKDITSPAFDFPLEEHHPETITVPDVDLEPPDTDSLAEEQQQLFSDDSEFTG